MSDNNVAVKSAGSPEDLPEIHRELLMVSGVTSSLRTKIEQLTERLAPVLRPAPPVPSPDSSPGPAVSTVVGDQLRSIYAQLVAAVEDVEMLDYRAAL